MKHRALGNTGLLVSEIGFGTWGLGGASGGDISYGPTNDEESRAALRCARDQGINFFDTSDLYGFGHSEELLGEVFAGARSSVLIASKAGFLDAQRQDFSPGHLRAAVERSLRRLRTDHLDLLQLHSPPIATIRSNPEIICALDDLRVAGKIRAWGISTRSPEEALAAVEEFAAPCVQVNFNLTDQRALTGGLFDLCRARGVGMIVRTPLCFGFLTGRYGGAMTFDTLDHRSRWPREQVERWQQANDAFAFLFEAHPGDTAAQIALRFCLSHPAVSTVIPGMLTPSQVNENAAASQLGPLPADELRRAAEAYAATEFFVPRTAGATA